MTILALNSGSSSVKFKLIEIDAADPGRTGRPPEVLVAGAATGIGTAGRAVLELTGPGATSRKLSRPVPAREPALRWLFEQLGAQRIDAVGHRVVHGGTRFHRPVRIDADVLAELEGAGELAPLHNAACVAGIRAAQAVLGPGTPMVAVFDTAFHHGMPERAAAYAIPRDLAGKLGIRRYGFHGIAHASLVAAYAAAAGRPPEDVRAVTLHLGNGCSAAAVRGGRSIDTSMGFTPLEGLVMGTRCGDLDPAVVGFLMRRGGMDAAEVERALNERSGLLGLSGFSADMRDLLAAEREGDARALLAIEVFCYRARKYLGAYLAALGGAEAVVFGGGIGEQAPAIRARICEEMAWCGLCLDEERNTAAVGPPAGTAVRISRPGASIAAYVAAADEETEIARETARCLRGGQG